LSEGQNQEGRQLFCRVIAPEKVLYDGEADLVVARIADGDIGVMVDHAPVVSTVEVGAVRITEDDERYVFATSDGFFKVSENLVQILVEEAVPPDEIDVNEAENRVEEAESELSELSPDEEDEGAQRKREEIERRRSTAENLVRVAREYGEG
jgi:F-type H+-transporting ATPase subunit epsilon